MTKPKLQSRAHKGKEPFTVATLRELLDADYSRGILIWRARSEETFKTLRAARVWNSRFAGQPIKPRSDRYGYARFTLQGITVSFHRVIFAHFHGHWPRQTIDHINRVKDDNRIENLRDISNFANNLARGQEGSLPRGIKRSSNGKKFVATIGKNKFKGSWLGTFDTLEQAEDARRKALAERGVAL